MYWDTPGHLAADVCACRDDSQEMTPGFGSPAPLTGPDGRHLLQAEDVGRTA